jgi:hypothetical protein
MREQLRFTKNELQSGNNDPTNESQTTSESTGNATSNPNFEKYVNLGFYFGNDFPKKNQPVPNYNVEFDRYTSTSNREFYSKQVNSSETSTFFDTAVIPNYDVAKALTFELVKQLEQNTGTVTIDIDSSSSAPASIQYNKELSARRIDSTIKFFNEQDSLRKFLTGSPQRLIIRPGVASGETATSQPMASKPDNKGPYTIDSLTEKKQLINCSDGDNTSGGDTVQSDRVGSKDIFTVPAMSCRRAFISKITSTLTAPDSLPISVITPDKSPGLPPGGTGGSSTNEQTPISDPNIVTQVSVPRDNITKRILRSLLSECDYFEMIKEETPMVFDNLKDKLKFFQPAFHSTTPEGLNSRLTFLQQCMRPGDTIPTVKEINGTPQLQYNNATNTAYGAPPVLILRIGDFYNTKIIPNSLGIQYESLDINPEGIGIQPMIANITLSFNFVGGSGLKESIDKLQNALTFNYYANTEIWDDRADVTDDSYKVFDEELLKGQVPPGPPTINQAAVENGQSNNSTIGTILSSVVVSEFEETGTISYSDFMVKFKDDTQTYFQTVVNKNKETVAQYNNAVRQQWMTERSYTDGIIIGLEPTVESEDTTILFGKPSNLEKRFDKIFKDLESDIKSDDDGFIDFMKADSNNFSRKVIRQLKENYKNLVINKRSEFQNGISKIVQDVTNAQQSYIQTIGRVNIILFDGEGVITDNDTGTDGFQSKSGPIKIYKTSGTTEVNQSSEGDLNTLSELFSDTKKINNSLKEFNTLITSETEFTSTTDGVLYKGILVFETDTKGKAQNAPTVNDVFLPFSLDSEFDKKPFRRVYMIVSDDVIDDKKYEKFKTNMIGNIINNQGIIGSGNSDIESKFDEYWITLTKPLFVKENNITKEFIEYVETDKLKDFLNYTPFEKKERVLTYTSLLAIDEDVKKTINNMISSLAETTNRNTKNNTWNSKDGNSDKAYISKVKLN